VQAQSDPESGWGFSGEEASTSAPYVPPPPPLVWDDSDCDSDTGPIVNIHEVNAEIARQKRLANSRSCVDIDGEPVALRNLQLSDLLDFQPQKPKWRKPDKRISARARSSRDDDSVTQLVDSFGPLALDSVPDASVSVQDSDSLLDANMPALHADSSDSSSNRSAPPT
jgi:hypothetical protein